MNHKSENSKDAAIREADEVLASVDRIGLESEDAEMILTLLDNPPRATAPMVEALNLHQRIVE